MAAASNQAARIVRSEPDPAEGEPARDASAVLADQLRAHLSDETARRPAEAPAQDKPAKIPTNPPRPRLLAEPRRRNPASANWF